MGNANVKMMMKKEEKKKTLTGPVINRLEEALEKKSSAHAIDLTMKFVKSISIFFSFSNLCLQVQLH